MSVKRPSFRNIKNFTRHRPKRTIAAALAILLAVASPIFIANMQAHAATQNIFPSTTPSATINTSDGNGVELGVKFTSDESGQVTGVRFYKGDATNGGTHYGHLWTADGTMLAQAQFTSETTTGWQDVSFYTPVNISANTMYVVSYYAPQGHYDYTNGGLSTAQDNPPLHTVADATSPNGVYAYTGTATGAFPTSSFNASNYWVDVDFTPGSGSSDTTAPTVSITSPASNQTVSGNVSVAANATDDAAVASVQFYLDGQALGNAVTSAPYTTSWNTALATDGSHTLTAKATDTSGNVGTSSGVTVTVQNGASAYTNIFTNAGTPAATVASDSGAVELGVKFTSDTSGQISGIRFYKGDTTNGGTHYGHLWTASGTQLAQVQFTNESASGWQDAKFAAPVNVAANTTYIASYTAPQGHYSDTASGLTNAVDNAPLHALANSTSTNGVFTYTTNATGAFPTSSFNASNYWVDIDFNTGGNGDTTAPTVSVTSPTADQTVSGSTTVTATATDDAAVASVQFYLDGQALGSAVTSVPYTANWDTTQVANGSHTLTAKATDTSGNVGTAANITVTVQNSGSSGSATSIWPSTYAPTHADGGDTNSGNLGVKFSSDTSGYITGIRFYKSGNNTGTHIGELWDTSGNLLAQATFTNESASGWQNVAFSQNVPITAGTTYVASYFDPVGHYSYDHGTDPGGLTNAVNNPPLHALASGASGGNGVFNYSSTASFPNQTFSDSNYWVDVLFSTTNTPPDTTPPTVSVASPTAGQTVSGTTTVTASASDDTAVTSVQFYLDGQAIGNPLTSTPYSFNWDTTSASNGTHMLTAKASDANGNTGTSASVQITVQNSVPPRTGIRGSGPVLVLTDPTNAYSDDYCYALFKTEGVPECAATDTGNLDSSFSLSSYRTIVLADGAPLTSGQVTLISNWVNAGGTFIAMRPNDNLDSLLGIGQSAGAMGDAYYKVDPAQLPGIETQTMQYHGNADKHSLTGATALATLYSNASTATAYPAVTKHTVGSGTAEAYMFDVSQSVLLTRNGNPSLAGQVTVSGSFDGNARFVDRFANGWLDTSKVSIPQADELQHTLTNLVEQSASAPRLWYFPAYNGSTIKAALILTGDDHASGSSQTLSRFAAEQAASPANCSVADWTCYTSTSYAFPGAFSDSAAKPYTDSGFEVSPHIADGGSCLAGWSTYSQLDSKVSSAIGAWQSSYPTISAAYPPQTERFHCYGIWNDYASIPLDEAAHGIKADTNSPCWPNSFLNTGQCLFTGTGMPEDYSNTNGKLTGVYQFTTQATDENPSTVDAAAMNMLVTNATGANAYYGYFTVLCHLDNLAISNQCATDLLSIAQTNNIPMVSAKQAEKFWDDRENSSVSNISYGASTLSFTVNAQAKNMQEMTPVNYNGKTLSSITVGGSNTTYTVQTINGAQYAFVTIPTGSNNLVANYQ